MYVDLSAGRKLYACETKRSLDWKFLLFQTYTSFNVRPPLDIVSKNQILHKYVQ